MGAYSTHVVATKMGLTHGSKALRGGDLSPGKKSGLLSLFHRSK